MENPIETLPAPVRERLHPVGAPPVPGDPGEFVMYWMRTAARAHENPALDGAVELANRLDVPAFVFHGVSESYPYASARHHTFILEGARDVSAELHERGIGYLCHVERPGQRGSQLQDLAERAAAVVTEDMPVDPLRRWTRALAERCATPVYAVDTDCLVPMRSVAPFQDRAYKFREVTKYQRKQRIERTWSDATPDFARFVPDDPGFDPVDVETVDLPALVAACDIDHGVGPVPGTVGGSRAGYERWRAFRDERLDSYHRSRNDPTRLDGSSRMSAYLHFGHVSPFRLARQAATRDSQGADKYVDELVVWRELAHHFCLHRADYDQPSALPDWALATLRERESDPRPALYDWETLARGDTGDALWNLCQRSLLTHGELHNNVRMTWAKKLLEWTPDIERALEVAIDLNHRFALDGRDPNSYLGIQWCYGGFDRPFAAEDEGRPILGRVRPRDTDWHAKQIGMEAYEDIVTRPLTDPLPRVAVIGAGIAGLTCARTLRDHGLSVDVFEKSRGPGGRSSTRRAPGPDDTSLRFDHGAQYFTARGEVFGRHVDAWAEAGRVARWTPRLAVIEGDGEDVPNIRAKESDTTRWVGLPGMSDIAGHLGADLTESIRLETRVDTLRERRGRWELRSTEGEDLGVYDVVVSTCPPVQTAELLAETGASFLETVRAAEMHPVWALMVAFEEPLAWPFDAAFVNAGPLDWIARNASKPGRPESPDTWVVHADSEWSAGHLEMDFDEAAQRLRERFADTVGRPEITERPTRYLRAHRWRYAKAAAGRETGCLADTDAGLLVAGDWLAGSRIEGAFDSGRAAAGRVLGACLDRTTARQPAMI